MKRRAKLPRYTLKQLKERHTSRSRRSKSLDESKRAKTVLSPDDPRVAYWYKRPGDYDVEGIDTPDKSGKKREETSTVKLVKPKYGLIAYINGKTAAFLLSKGAQPIYYLKKSVDLTPEEEKALADAVKDIGYLIKVLDWNDYDYGGKVQRPIIPLPEGIDPYKIEGNVYSKYYILPKERVEQYLKKLNKYAKEFNSKDYAVLKVKSFGRYPSKNNRIKVKFANGEQYSLKIDGIAKIYSDGWNYYVLYKTSNKSWYESKFGTPKNIDYSELKPVSFEVVDYAACSKCGSLDWTYEDGGFCYNCGEYTAPKTKKVFELKPANA